MKLQFNQISKEEIITTQSVGAVIKKAIVYDCTYEKKREIEPYTIIKVQGFNYLTKKVITHIEFKIIKFI